MGREQFFCGPFFLPNMQPVSVHEHYALNVKWLRQFNKDIDNCVTFSGVHKAHHVVADRLVWALSQPIWTRGLKDVSHDLRYVQDARLLRVDNDFAVNGREVFVPYIVSRKKFEPYASTKSRKYSMSVFCTIHGECLTE